MIFDKDLNDRSKEEHKSSISLDAMLLAFDPENDERDRRILYEITKVRLD